MLNIRGYVKWVVALGIVLALFLLDSLQRHELESFQSKILSLTQEKSTIAVEEVLSKPAIVIREMAGVIKVIPKLTQENYESIGKTISDNYGYVVQTGVISKNNQVLVEYPHNPSALYGETITKILYSGGKTFITGDNQLRVYVSDYTETSEGRILLYSVQVDSGNEGKYLYLAAALDKLVNASQFFSSDNDNYWLAIYDSQKQEVFSHRMDQAQDQGAKSELFSGGDNPWTVKVGFVTSWNRNWIVGRFVNFSFGIVLAILIWVLIYLLDRRARDLSGEVEKRTKDLENVNKEMEEFVYVVSHDLKAPLITIQGMVDLFLDSEEKRLSKRGEEFMKSIREASERMGDLIGDLLQLSRVGRFDTEEEMVNIAEVVEVVFSEVRTIDIKKRFNFTMDGEFPALKVNRRRIYQIFANLVNNSVKFMDPNNPSPYVRVSCADLGEFYEFRVKDNGPGIDPRYHKKVFGVFQRLHGREVEGTGIGLAFVKKIVDRMGGIIWIESEVGKGAEFIFTLPKPE